jgi:membrane dipeptidase
MTDANRLHHSLLTIDTHIDIFWPNTPDPFTRTEKCVDFVKMREGHMVAGCFVAYVPQGPRTPEGFAAARERALGMLATINARGRTEAGITARVAATADAIEAGHRDGACVVVPAVENGHAIGEDLGLLRTFRDLGATYLTLVHNGHNLLCDSANPRADLGDAATLHGGLSEFGRSAIAELNRVGMLIDVSHASRDAMLQAAEVSRTPVVATHSCCRALCDNPRNMDDTQLDALRQTGGLIQITAVPGFVRAQGKADSVTFDDYCAHIDHAVQRVGIEHVGIGSDFDGGGGFTGWRDAADCPNLTAALLSRGYDAAAVTLLWGGNFLRALRRAEAAAA